MRSYGHQVDEDRTRRALTRTIGRFDHLQTSIDEVGSADLSYYPVAVRAAVDAGIYAWALGEPVDTVASYWRRALAWITAALTFPITVNTFDASIWVTVPLVAGSLDLLASTVRLTPDRVERWAESESLVREFLRSYTALVRGAQDEAAEAAEAMSHLTTDPETPPYTADSYAALDSMLAAAITPDQQLWDEACPSRTAAITSLYDRSVEARRNPYGMLDLTGVGVAALAARRGLRLLPNSTYLGTELIEHWPGEQ